MSKAKAKDIRPLVHVRGTEPLYLPEEVAAILRVSKSTVYDMINNGDFDRVYKIGQQKRIAKGSVDKYLESVRYDPGA